jgi:hypothetical protein
MRFMEWVVCGAMTVGYVQYSAGEKRKGGDWWDSSRTIHLIVIVVDCGLTAFEVPS